MGKAAIDSHAKHNKRHQQIVSAQESSLPLNQSARQALQDAQRLPQNLMLSEGLKQNFTANLGVPKEKANINTIQKFVLKDDVTKMEIFWCLYCIQNFQSLRDIESLVLALKKVFPNDEIVQKLQLAKSKAGYTIVFGLGPYFQKKLLDDLEICEHVVMGFDESLNKVTKMQQMDLVVRFWDKVKDEVSARYFTSVFLKRTNALALLNGFLNYVPTSILEKIIQISMDGPNVNLKFLRDFQAELDKNTGNMTLVDIGSCGLHTLNCAFRGGFDSTPWKLSSYLYAQHKLFQYSPTKISDYIEASECSLLPKSFCKIRWLENSDCVIRARAIIGSLKLYVKYCVDNKKIPTNVHFYTIEEMLKDPLLDAKLAFFESFSLEIEPFLTEFQTEKPYAPFLYNSLLALCEIFMKRIVKAEILDTELGKIDFSKKENLLPSDKIDIGFTVKEALRSVKGISKLDILRFKDECRTCIQTFLKKMMERSPLKFALTKGISCLDPSVAITSRGTARLSITLNRFVQNKIISGVEADRVKSEYVKLCNKESVKVDLKNYNRKNERLDKFWMSLIRNDSDGEESYCNLMKFIKIVLIMSHGNATLERGFSVNKNCVVENQTGKSLIAQRAIYDGLSQFKNGLDLSIINKNMIHAARNAHSHYTEFLDKEKKTNLQKFDFKKKQEEKTRAVKELEKKKEILERCAKETALISEQILDLRNQT